MEIRVIVDGKEYKHVEAVSESAVVGVPRFMNLPDGWVRDFSQGLDFGPSSSKSMSYADAEKYCISKGGRLPMVKELFALVDRSVQEPAIDKYFFSDTKNDYYWTSDKTIWNISARWVVGFGSGYVYYDFGEFDG